MSWRTVVITKTCKLDYSIGYLVVRDVEKTTKIHISEISMLIVESTSVAVTVALLNELTKKSVKVIFCDEKHSPSFEVTPYYDSCKSSLKLKQQIDWDDHIKQYIWTNIVAEKISNQAKVLKQFQLPQYTQLLHYIDEIEFNDATNREGHSAKVYFNALFGKDFTRTEENSINAALNYGYGIILSAFNREIVSNGYITQIGLFHDNMFNQFNLGSDLMEPFRPLVDYIVRSLMPQKFEREEKLEILRILQQEVTIAGRREVVNNAIKIYCKSVFDALNENDTSLIKFYKDEL